MTNFDSLGLSEALLRAVRNKGYEKPSPIQAKAIPAVLSGKDVFAAAQTGTGKTAGFTLPLLQLLSTETHTGRRNISALIITPTRELAAQIQESVREYGQFLSLRSAVVFGGVPINPQKAILNRGVDILVATPGRLLDLSNQRCVDLSKVKMLVLDEADRMLDMGFIHDIRKVLALVPKQRQNLLFSATFSEDIRKLAGGFMNDPVSISVSPKNTTAETVSQQMYKVDRGQKPALLKHLIKTDDWKQVLVFTRTKHGANRLARKLGNSGIQSMAIHGNKSQGARTKALRAFKNGEVRVLVATDIAARGLDIEQLPWVVNFDLPNVAEDYVHRIGRTGRAGMTGQAVSLVSIDEAKQLRGIERLLGKRMPMEVIDGFEPGTKTAVDTKDQGTPNRKSKALPSRKQQRRKPPRKKTETAENENRQNRSEEQTQKGNKSKPTNNRSNNSKQNKPRPEKAKSANQSNNQQNKKSKPKSQKKKNESRGGEKNTKTSKFKKDSNYVPFSKAHKKRKPGKKGPIGYGMFPLE